MKNPLYEYINTFGEIKATSADKLALMKMKAEKGGTVRPQVVVIKQAPLKPKLPGKVADVPKKVGSILNGTYNATELGKKTGFSPAGISFIRKELKQFAVGKYKNQTRYSPDALTYLLARGKTPGRNRIKIAAQKRAAIEAAKKMKGKTN